MNLTFYTRPNTTGHTHIITLNMLNREYHWTYGVELDLYSDQVQNAIMVSKRDFDNILASVKTAEFSEVFEIETE